MPTYVYKCNEEHYKEVLHSMTYSTGVVCDCGEPMKRVPQAVGVIWGGLPPHKEHMIGPAAREVLDNYEKNRYEYIGKQEKRGKYLNE